VSAVAPHPEAGPFRAARSPFLWLLEREIVRFLKLWRFALVGQVLSALLFLLVFGIALAGRIDAVGGVPYKRFILPGLVVQAVFTVGFVNGTTSLFEARHDGYINAVLASPLRWWEINLALVVGSIVREIIVGAGVLALAGPFVGLGLSRPLVAVGALVALLVTGAQVGVLAGAYARSLDDIYSIESLAVLPLGFLSGIFYSVDRLPGEWRTLTHLDPLFYFVEVARIGVLGTGDISAGVALAVAGGIAAVLTTWSLAVFRSASTLKP
jgi:ABC-2 type transport system permease protein